MKRTLLLTGLLLLLGVSLASAAGVNINWGVECYGDAPAASLTWACGSNLYASSLPGAGGSNTIAITMSYALPYPKTNVVASDIYLEGVSDNETDPVPAWWQMNDGECRGNPNVVGVITLSGVYAGSSGGPPACFDYYQGTGGGGLGLYSDEGSRTHINGTWAVPDPLGEVPANQETYAATYRIKTAKTFGTGACAGCTTPWTWAFNYTQIAFQNEQVSLQLGDPIPGGNQCLSWNGGAHVCGPPLPARATTWGQIKSLYR